MRIHISGTIHFDGTWLAIELRDLSEVGGERLLGTHGDTPEAKLIARLRASGIEVFDRRHEKPEPAEPVALHEVELEGPEPEPAFERELVDAPKEELTI